MDLFEFDALAEKTSKYETNHLHMYVEDNIEFPNVQDMETTSYATFIHEYVHYIQHLTTLFGVRICDMNHRMFLLYRDYLVNHDSVDVPLHLWENDNKLKSFRETFRLIAGDRACSHNIDAVDIKLADIDYAEQNRTAVNIGIYDFDNEKALDKGFQFGYYCVIEGMAHAIQSIINNDIHHRIVPYRAVEYILSEICPQYANDPKMIASICLSALHWDNPGVGFFKVLDIQKEFNYSSGLELYKHIACDYSVLFQGHETPRYRLMVRFLKDLKVNLEQIVRAPLEYYNQVIDSCILEAGQPTSKLLEVLYEKDIADKSRFINDLADYYGLPLIDANNYTAMPTWTDKEGKQHPYQETASIYGMELLISRLIEVNNEKVCRRFEICSKNMYSDPDHCVASNECRLDPWNKNETCIFTGALHYYKLDKKTFNITD